MQSQYDATVRSQGHWKRNAERLGRTQECGLLNYEALLPPPGDSSPQATRQEITGKEWKLRSKMDITGEPLSWEWEAFIRTFLFPALIFSCPFLWILEPCIFYWPFWFHPNPEKHTHCGYLWTTFHLLFVQWGSWAKRSSVRGQSQSS